MGNDIKETARPTEIPPAWMQGFDGAMGFRLTTATKDEVVLEYVVDDRHRQPYGIIHGGVHCAAIETVCSTGAALNAIPRGQSPGRCGTPQSPADRAQLAQQGRSRERQ